MWLLERDHYQVSADGWNWFELELHGCNREKRCLCLAFNLDKLYWSSLGSNHRRKNLNKGTFLVRVQLKIFVRNCDVL